MRLPFQSGGVVPGGLSFGGYKPGVQYQAPDVGGFADAFLEAERQRQQQQEQKRQDEYRRAQLQAMQTTQSPAPILVYNNYPQAPLPAAAPSYYNPYLGINQPSANIYPQNFQLGGIAPMVPMMMPPQPGSTDTVPAALTPGEMVLTRRQQSAVRPIPGRAKRLRPEQRVALKQNRGY